ncbi:hypothetical protein LSUE1_G000747 [Lachnellula suecica]|uniref:SET domain-containing protein n=1 Tax=Lachnellula suecica TaxID=602035 RepID=A0A8T9CHC3_9HELO|nr:hypothetical protein LSUE1_G000747 [Lachnellula suecica]
MDSDDVSDIGQYMQVLESQKLMLKAAESRTGQIPLDRKSRAELVHKQHMMAIQIMIKHNQQDHQIQSSFLPEPYPPSIASIAELTPIHIKDLRIGIHHRGRYILVRSIAAPTRMTAIMSIIEDENGDAIAMQLYQQLGEDVRPASSIIPVGDVFLLKEPYFKVMGDGEYGLRIDHISDAVRIDTQHKVWPQLWNPRLVDLSKTADDWKQEGNIEMGKKQHWAAIQSYTTALESHPSASEENIIRLNRALAYLQDKNFEAALADTQCFEPNPSTSEKSLYRAGKALYGLGRFSQCCEILGSLCERYPNNSEAAKELARARLRLLEQQNGTYDFKAIYKEVSKARPPHLDHATFVGPVEIKNSPGRGRGLFNTKAVKAGELLLCEKAFAHCYANESEDSSGGVSETRLLVNMHTNRMTMGTQSELITAIVQKLDRNPSLLPEFTALHHGSYETVGIQDGDGKPVIDSFLVATIIGLNSFGCSLTTKDAHLGLIKKPEGRHHSCGVWPIASKVNHACHSNVRRSFIGDLQIMRASCDIPANTELTFWYRIPTGDCHEMQKGLENWGFQCKCEICIDSENTPKKMLKKRNDLFGDLKATLDVANVNTAKAERLLKALGQTYKKSPAEVPRLALREPYTHLAAIFSQQKNAEKVVAMVLKTVESLGFVIRGAHLPVLPAETFRVERWGVMMDDVIGMWVHLWNAYSEMAPHLLPQVAECGKTAYKICIGEDVTFKESYEQKGDLE